MMTFRNWLLDQTGRPDIVGDLARDVARDPDVPDGYRAMRGYFKGLPGTTRFTLIHFDVAWERYKVRPRRSPRLGFEPRCALDLYCDHIPSRNPDGMPRCCLSQLTLGARASDLAPSGRSR